ncbi:MAG: rRNA maturation RNase YbeY [Desulfatirhabdiaceae bacterium]
MGYPEHELSILIVDDSQIEALNRDYLHHEGPTNVISFPMQEGECSGINPHILGDVVISVDTAKREAEMAGIPFYLRFMQLLIHGILHLAGYDHEGPEADAEKMEAKSDELILMLSQLKETA